MQKVAFFDIDGTILDLDGKYSPRLKDAIARVQDMGICTGVASGRPLFASQFLIDELGLNAAGVFCTGAHIYEPSTKATLKAEYIEPICAKTLLEALRSSPFYYELYADNQFFYEHDRAPNIRMVHQHHLRCMAEEANFDNVLPSDKKIVKFFFT